MEEHSEHPEIAGGESPRSARPRKPLKRRYERNAPALWGNGRLWVIIAGVGAYGIGIGLLVWGTLLSAGNLSLLSGGTRVQGTVTRVEYVERDVERKYRDSSGTERTTRERVKVPVSTITFRAENEEQYSFSAGSIADSGAIENTVGYKVGVIYDAANPQSARIDNGWAQWQPSLVMFGFGLAFLFMGTMGVRTSTQMRLPGRSRGNRIRITKAGKVLDATMVVAWNAVALWALFLWMTQSRLSETMHYGLCIVPAVLLGAMLMAGTVRMFQPRAS